MPDWKKYVRENLPRLGVSAAREQEIVDELAQQLEAAYAAAIARGSDPARAELAARSQFSDWKKLAGEIRSAERPLSAAISERTPINMKNLLDEDALRKRRGGNLLSDAWQDVRVALRMLRRKPAFAAVVVFTLALGIGANTVMFSMVNSVLLRPLPYAEPDRLTVLWEIGLPKGGFFALQAKTTKQWVEGYSRDAGYNLSGESEPVRVVGGHVTAGLFSLLGVNPEIGRNFVAADQKASEHGSVVMLSRALSERLYGANANPLGHWLTIEGNRFQVIGVMPKAFHFPTTETEFWLPVHMTPGGADLWGAFAYVAVGRLRPGVSVAEANAEYRALVPQVVKLFPWPMPAHYAEWTNAQPMQNAVVGEVREKLLLLFGAVALVLLIACVNVSNLLLARAASRQREIAVRAAIGASRMRLVRQLITESLIIAALGGMLALAMAAAGFRALKLILPAETPRLAEASLDYRVMVFAAVAVIFTGLAFGLLPALRASRRNFETAMRGTGTGAGQSRARRRLSHGLVVAESALMAVLLVGAALTVKSLWQLTHLETGMHADHIVSALITPPVAMCGAGDHCVSYFRELRERAAAISGVESAAEADNVPFNGVYFGVIAVEERPEYSSTSPLSTYEFVTSPGLISTLGIPLLSGRDFTDADREGSPAVAMVSRDLAEKLWPGKDPVGRRLKPSWMKDWRTVVGVVADVREYAVYPDGAEGRVFGDVYFPAAQGVIDPATQLRLVLRTRQGGAEVTAGLRALLKDLRGDVAVSQIRTMDEVMARSVAAPRATTSLFAIFAGLAFALGLIGIYSVVAHSVAERTREIGVRMAIGAQRGDVVRMILVQGMLPATMGIAAGLVLAAASARVMASLLYGAARLDVGTLIAVVILLGGAASVACWIPARRATRVDPVIALREE